MSWPSRMRKYRGLMDVVGLQRGRLTGLAL